ncbi:hypothetical protein N657DRAFT_675616 [Parathielavia appendiculata]|uniref:Uncharacterized protein n=1 Tax=Parathielavia appendiculata TaxID=2587402 RepID=A0AAN6TPM2_9PEZI|nr:hypothetical protein N657DRAFT_675616 [Parathielavia appendiculata]
MVTVSRVLLVLLRLLQLTSAVIVLGILGYFFYLVKDAGVIEPNARLVYAALTRTHTCQEDWYRNYWGFYWARWYLTDSPGVDMVVTGCRAWRTVLAFSFIPVTLYLASELDTSMPAYTKPTVPLDAMALVIYSHAVSVLLYQVLGRME